MSRAKDALEPRFRRPKLCRRFRCGSTRLSARAGWRSTTAICCCPCSVDAVAGASSSTPREMSFGCLRVRAVLLRLLGRCGGRRQWLKYARVRAVLRPRVAALWADHGAEQGERSGWTRTPVKRSGSALQHQQRTAPSEGTAALSATPSDQRTASGAPREQWSTMRCCSRCPLLSNSSTSIDGSAMSAATLGGSSVDSNPADSREGDTINSHPLQHAADRQLTRLFRANLRSNIERSAAI